MMMAVRSGAVVTLLIVLNALLLASFAYEVNNLELEEGVVTEVTDPLSVDLPLRNIASVAGRSIGDYAAITSRPLFNDDRLPQEKSENGSADEDAQAFTLVGVILSAEQQLAIIYSRSQEQPVKVALWEWIEGWRLVSVEAQGVHLRKGNRSLDLALQRNSSTAVK